MKRKENRVVIYREPFLIDVIRNGRHPSEADTISKIWKDSRHKEIQRFHVDVNAYVKLRDMLRDNEDLYREVRHMARSPFANTYVEFDWEDGSSTGVYRTGNRAYVTQNSGTHPGGTRIWPIEVEIQSTGISVYSLSRHEWDMKNLRAVHVANVALTEILWVLMNSGKNILRTEDVPAGGKPDGRGTYRWAAHTSLRIDLSPSALKRTVQKIYRTERRGKKAFHMRRGHWCRFSWEWDCEHQWSHTLVDEDGWVRRKDCEKCGSIHRWIDEHGAGGDCDRTKFHTYQVTNGKKKRISCNDSPVTLNGIHEAEGEPH